MKNLNILFVFILLGGMTFSCGESSRSKAHEKVVEEERTEDDRLVGLNPESTAREVEIVASDLEFQPNEITVQAGQQLSIELLNQGEEEHNIEFELPSGEKEFQNNVMPGSRGILEIEAPQEAGTYTFYCPVDNHHEKGMEGRLIVTQE